MAKNKTNFIGLDKDESKDLAEGLNNLLANFQVYYQNLRAFHWNIKGNSFFELHAKFEELYTEAHENIDELAERILTLGVTPLHSFSSYLEHSKIKEGKNISDGTETVNHIVTGLNTLLKIERKLLSQSSSLEDEGTSTLLSDLIKSQEKTIWMFDAYSR